MILVVDVSDAVGWRTARMEPSRWKMATVLCFISLRSRSCPSSWRLTQWHQTEPILVAAFIVCLSTFCLQCVTSAWLLLPGHSRQCWDQQPPGGDDVQQQTLANSRHVAVGTHTKTLLLQPNILFRCWKAFL